jgi:hypothetical protein
MSAPERDEPSGLEQAVALAKSNEQIAIWDLAERPWAIALYDARTKQLHPLTDEEAAIVINSDPLIRREWRRWNAMNGNRGSLIVLSGDRIQQALNEGRDAAEDNGDAAEPT